MRPETPLDAAFMAQEADPDPALWLRFHERILDAELAVPLEAGEELRPQVFALEEGRFVLAFDRDERLADFLGAPTEFAALSGRRLAALLAGRGVGIALNLGAPSATLLPAAAVDWLAAMATPAPTAREGRLGRLSRPEAVAPELLAALAAKLAAMADAVPAAHLVATGEGLLLALTGVPDAAREGVAAAVAEALRFSADPGELDVTFLEAGSTAAAAVASAGLRLELPRAEVRAPTAPGMDRERPPRLR